MEIRWWYQFIERKWRKRGEISTSACLSRNPIEAVLKKTRSWVTRIHRRLWKSDTRKQKWDVRKISSGCPISAYVQAWCYVRVCENQWKSFLFSSLLQKLLLFFLVRITGIDDDSSTKWLESLFVYIQLLTTFSADLLRNMLKMIEIIVIKEIISTRKIRRSVLIPIKYTEKKKYGSFRKTGISP